MSEINEGGPAFPCHSDQSWAEGMTLRDYFAAKAMQGILAYYGAGGGVPDRVARSAYAAADAMLAERDKGRDA